VRIEDFIFGLIFYFFFLENSSKILFYLFFLLDKLLEKIVVLLKIQIRQETKMILRGHKPFIPYEHSSYDFEIHESSVLE